MKRYLLITLLITLTKLVNAADIVEINGIFYDLKPVKVGTASVTYDPTVVNRKEYSGSVIIPSEIEYDGNTYKVNEIGTYAFMGCRELTSVELPEGLITIGFGGFDGCSGLQTINIPSTVTTIMQWAFRDCTSLTGVNITDIEAWCNIDFDDYGNPLYYSNHLIINGVDTENLVIPDDVTTIKSRVFNGFASLKSVNLGKGVTSIGSYAFAWCTSLTTISIPDNVKEIGGCAFYECSALKDINLSSSLELLDKSVFEKCSSLEKIKIPNGIKTIETYAFSGCTNLKKLYLSESVEKIGASAFGSCENIEDVYCYAIDPPTPTITWYVNVLSDYFWQSYAEYATLHVPESSIDIYKNATFWKNFGTIVALTEDDTAINTTSIHNCLEKYYSLDGHHIYSPKKGINIIKMPNGQIKKTIVK